MTAPIFFETEDEARLWMAVYTARVGSQVPNQGGHSYADYADRAVELFRARIMMDAPVVANETMPPPVPVKES